MTRRVKAKREKLQHKKYRGLITQFTIFLILRTVDLAASVAVLENAWEHSYDWKTLNYTLFNTASNVPGGFSSHIIKPRSINLKNVNPAILSSLNFNPSNSNSQQNSDVTKLNHNNSNITSLNFKTNFTPENSDRKSNPERFNLESFHPTNFDRQKFTPRDMISRRYDPGKTGSRRKNLRDIVRRSVRSRLTAANNSQYALGSSKGNTATAPEYCQAVEKWNEKTVKSKISGYKSILAVTVFFNIISLGAFVTHFGFWVATLKITFEDGVDFKTRVTRLTRNSLLSLLTALIRDVPLSCLNVELLARRSGHDGLACVACIFAGKCVEDEYIEKSLGLAKSLLYFNYFVMLVNSLWKGVSGFYRLVRFKDFNMYLIRACASTIFGFLYAIATFTPAMFMFIYRYFAIPGLDAPILHDMASRLVVIGAAIWVVFMSVVFCCPILYAIRV